jgi:hypothetical protein
LWSVAWCPDLVIVSNEACVTEFVHAMSDEEDAELAAAIALSMALSSSGGGGEGARAADGNDKGTSSAASEGVVAAAKASESKREDKPAAVESKVAAGDGKESKGTESKSSGSALPPGAVQSISQYTQSEAYSSYSVMGDIAHDPSASLSDARAYKGAYDDKGSYDEAPSASAYDPEPPALEVKAEVKAEAKAAEGAVEQKQEAKQDFEFAAWSRAVLLHKLAVPAGGSVAVADTQLSEAASKTWRFAWQGSYQLVHSL